jgi:hypothetical protein
MLEYPNITHDCSERIHSSENMVRIVTGILAAATKRSAVVSPRIKALVDVLSSLDLQIIIHMHTFPIMALIHTIIKNNPSKYIRI